MQQNGSSKMSTFPKTTQKLFMQGKKEYKQTTNGLNSIHLCQQYHHPSTVHSKENRNTTVLQTLRK